MDDDEHMGFLYGTAVEDNEAAWNAAMGTGVESDLYAPAAMLDEEVGYGYGSGAGAGGFVAPSTPARRRGRTKRVSTPVPPPEAAAADIDLLSLSADDVMGQRRGQDSTLAVAHVDPSDPDKWLWDKKWQAQEWVPRGMRAPYGGGGDAVPTVSTEVLLDATRKFLYGTSVPPLRLAVKQLLGALQTVKDRIVAEVKPGDSFSKHVPPVPDVVAFMGKWMAFVDPRLAVPVTPLNNAAFRARVAAAYNSLGASGDVVMDTLLQVSKPAWDELHQVLRQLVMLQLLGFVIATYWDWLAVQDVRVPPEAISSVVLITLLLDWSPRVDRSDSAARSVLVCPLHPRAGDMLLHLSSVLQEGLCIKVGVAEPQIRLRDDAPTRKRIQDAVRDCYNMHTEVAGSGGRAHRLVEYMQSTVAAGKGAPLFRGVVNAVMHNLNVASPSYKGLLGGPTVLDVLPLTSEEDMSTWGGQLHWRLSVPDIQKRVRALPVSNRNMLLVRFADETSFPVRDLLMEVFSDDTVADVYKRLRGATLREDIEVIVSGGSLLPETNDNAWDLPWDESPVVRVSKHT